MSPSPLHPEINKIIISLFFIFHVYIFSGFDGNVVVYDIDLYRNSRVGAISPELCVVSSNYYTLSIIDFQSSHKFKHSILTHGDEITDRQVRPVGDEQLVDIITSIPFHSRLPVWGSGSIRDLSISPHRVFRSQSTSSLFSMFVLFPVIVYSHVATVFFLHAQTTSVSYVMHSPHGLCWIRASFFTLYFTSPHTNI